MRGLCRPPRADDSHQRGDALRYEHDEHLEASRWHYAFHGYVLRHFCEYDPSKTSNQLILLLQHIMGAYLSDGRLSLAMMAPGFLSITLGIIDMVRSLFRLLGWSTDFEQRFFILVGGTQAFATPTALAPQTPQLSQSASSASPVSATIDPAPSSRSTILIHLRTLQVQTRRLIAWIRAEDERIWFFTTSLVCIYLSIWISLPWHGSWLIFASSTWVGQIVRNVMRGSRRVFKKWVVLLMSCGRLAIPMCQWCFYLLILALMG